MLAEAMFDARLQCDQAELSPLGPQRVGLILISPEVTDEFDGFRSSGAWSASGQSNPWRTERSRCPPLSTAPRSLRARSCASRQWGCQIGQSQIGITAAGAIGSCRRACCTDAASSSQGSIPLRSQCRRHTGGLTDVQHEWLQPCGPIGHVVTLKHLSAARRLLTSSTEQGFIGNAEGRPRPSAAPATAFASQGPVFSGIVMVIGVGAGDAAGLQWTAPGPVMDRNRSCSVTTACPRRRRPSRQ